ncbi:MAG: hypothetical protein LC667_17185, partial [Thioalkalivibrio sp.]|nr:hypothetical protein [Thioalkalivibrio sp.]
MGAIRDLWDLLDPVLPTRVKDWGEAISDAADDIGTTVPDPTGEDDGRILKVASDALVYGDESGGAGGVTAREIAAGDLTR